ncbi:type 2 isopentenyl-diphosphate Delta-isomerase [Waddlia chondrophila]|uniref:Isopentenyl-diphosphate delta-isomerase n=2 Tax=Waddlia chondrophila TaxID=71667 RepID=D6YWG2_WADCW|nr:type 2 isopentenyl-diphosphate Delta-isomerase [Waddlia chondrophila]ADI38473.1 isopentenyl-diphosphate delta-isomerase [Waddlia chondrophila WSU 86-1044]
MSTATPANIPSRKQRHLDACMNQPVEGVGSTFFEDVMFVHRAMPELNFSEIDTSIEFLDKKISFPLFISCMTGGSDQGRLANRELAKAAQELNIPIGLGSIRVLFNHPERVDDFLLREYAPDIPIIANIGGAQIIELSMHEIREWLNKLEVDALTIHLNCGQELFQNGGDTRFRGIMDAIEKTIDNLSIPVIVKETGFGISPKEVKKLIAMGTHYVDLAGAGGTNWITVEQHINQTEDFASSAFMDWGTPTAILLDTVKKYRGKILSSGGLRSGMDLAKSIALGAHAGGMALPFIQASIDGGKEEAVVLGRTIEKVLKSTMLLTGSQTIEDLQQQPLIKSLEFEHFVQSLTRIDL